MTIIESQILILNAAINKIQSQIANATQDLGAATQAQIQLIQQDAGNDQIQAAAEQWAAARNKIETMETQIRKIQGEINTLKAQMKSQEAASVAATEAPVLFQGGKFLGSLVRMVGEVIAEMPSDARKVAQSLSQLGESAKAGFDQAKKTK